MNDERPSEVLGALPRTRPHRRSEKRPAERTKAQAAPKERSADTTEQKTRAESPPATQGKAAPRPKTASSTRAKAGARGTGGTRRRPAPKRSPERLQQPKQPVGTPPAPRSRKEIGSTGTDIIGTAVQAAAELAEIGFSLSARVLRQALSRLPRP